MASPRTFPASCPKGMAARRLTSSWSVPPVFTWLQESGRSDVRHDAHVQHGDRIDRRACSRGPGGPEVIVELAERGETSQLATDRRRRSYAGEAPLPIPDRLPILSEPSAGCADLRSRQQSASADRRGRESASRRLISVVISNREDAGRSRSRTARGDRHHLSEPSRLVLHAMTTTARW